MLLKKKERKKEKEENGNELTSKFSIFLKNVGVSSTAEKNQRDIEGIPIDATDS